jgi:hypothetical protein
VVVYYQLPAGADSLEIELTILDEAGTVVRSFTSTSDPDFQYYAGGPGPDPVLPKQAGLNRFVWDMRHASLPGAPKAYIEGSYRGHKVMPGTYQLQLRVGETIQKTGVEVQENPLYGLTAEEYADYDQFMQSAENKLREMHNLVNQMASVRGQLKDLLGEMGDPQWASLSADIQGLIDRMQAWDEEMVQRKSKAYDDVENFPNKFTANYLFALNHAESSIPRVNQPTRDRIQELNAQWEGYRQEAMTILEDKLPSLNQQLWEAGIGPIWMGLEKKK